MATATFDTRSMDAQARLAWMRRLAWLLDAQFKLPFTKFRFGANGMLGLAPIAGDVALGLVSLYLVWEAKRLGAPNALVGRMLANVAIEVAGGSVPVAGNLFDMAFKANLRNLALLEGWIQGRR